ncbi:hypothetical protein BH23BAC1_BH23BAC1_21800 [soil metagenome]
MDKSVITEDLNQLLTIEQQIDNLRDQIDQVNVQLSPMDTAVKIDEIFEIAESRKIYYNSLMELQHKMHDLEEERERIAQKILQDLPLENQKVLIESQNRGRIIIEKRVDPYRRNAPELIIHREE